MSVLVKVIRKIRSVFKEKQTIEPDDFELEHFLLYHGLVGSSPENQRQFKDVRADIKMAVEENSSTLMAINLKLLPLWWEDKLEQIFDEILEGETTKEELLEILCPERNDDTDVNNSTPLFHESWKVRANTAKILCHLEAREKEDEIIAALSATTKDTKLAFCHLVYSLAKLESEKAKDVIKEYLQDDDPWITVDATGSYSCLTTDAEDEALVDAILNFQHLDDYQAVQVTKYISLYDFINSENEKVQVAGYKLLSGIVKALQGTFSTEVHLESDLLELGSLLIERAKEKNSLSLTKCLYDLKVWFEDKPEGYSLASRIGKLLEEDETRNLAEKYLKEGKNQTSLENCQLYNAIKLAGELKLESCSKLLEEKVVLEHPYIDEILNSLAQIGKLSPECAKSIIKIIEDNVNLEERMEMEPSAQPVLEDATPIFKTYFWALKALSGNNSEETISFLMKASNDYAADKREQAIKSLISSSSNNENGNEKDKVEERVSKALADSSLAVRFTAVKGIATLNLASQVPKLMDLTSAKEVSLTAEAIETLSELAKNGHKRLIEDSVRAKLKTVRNKYHQEKFKTLLENLALIES